MESSTSSLIRFCTEEYIDSSSDEDEIESTAVASATLVAKVTTDNHYTIPPIQRRQVVLRDREAAHDRLMRDYFGDNPVHDDATFRRRFRMSKRLFLKICDTLEDKYSYFKRRTDARGKLGFSCIQKVTSALRVLAYGSSTDINDDYLKMAEKTTRDTMEHFTNGIIQQYGGRYLRKPTWHDLQQIYAVHLERHGLPGMIGSIDCMHWGWYGCPTAHRGQYTSGFKGYPSMVLQAVASHDLWIWSAFFGVAGSNNDVIVFRRSPLLGEILDETRATASFYANDNEYPYGYFLCDGIYPEWATFVKTFRDPINPKMAHFKKRQESARKDVERLFGVLKQRWNFLRLPCRLWTKEKIRDCMYACCILHNMILEDEGRAICQHYVPDVVQQFIPVSAEKRLQNVAYLERAAVHRQLKNDLVEHLWMFDPPRTPANEDDEDEQSGEEQSGEEHSGEEAFDDADYSDD